MPGKAIVNKAELEKHFNNLVVAVEAYRGTKLEHINLELALSAIQKELFSNEELEITDTNASIN